MGLRLLRRAFRAAHQAFHARQAQRFFFPARPAQPAHESAATLAGSDRDVAGYLAHYSAAFTPDKGLARSTWEAQRRNRLAAPRSISVAVHALSIEADGADRLIARFKQDFAADAYRETGTAKMLTLVREQGGWRIASEISGT